MLKIGITASLVSDYTVLFSEDPAIDKTVIGFKEIWSEYMQTGDHSKIPIRSGQEMTRFKLRHLRGRVRRQLQDKIRVSAVDDQLSPTAVYDACQIALVECENFLDETGKEIEIETIFDKKWNREIVSDDTMCVLESVRDEDGNEGALVNEIGLRAIMSMAPSPL